MRRGRGFATEVVGDPWFDRLNASLRRASAIAQRSVQYRAGVDHAGVDVAAAFAAGAAPGPARLLRELPVDEHRVAAILHPKI